jgi:chromosome segregation ATPase
VWPYDPDSVRSATLELASGLAVQLPPLGRGRRRFGRLVLDVRPVVRGEDEAGAYEQLRSHTQAVVAREDIDAAREEARRAREEAERARRELTNERDRAKAESKRMRDALLTAETLAERAVREREAVNKLLKAELADAYTAVAAEQERAAEADSRRQELDAQLEKAHAESASIGEEFERLHRSVEAAVAERDAVVAELQQLRTRLEAEHHRDVAALRERLEAAERAAAEAVQQRAGLERAVQQAQERSEVLSSRLAAVRQAVASDLPAD